MHRSGPESASDSTVKFTKSLFYYWICTKNVGFFKEMSIKRSNVLIYKPISQKVFTHINIESNQASPTLIYNYNLFFSLILSSNTQIVISIKKKLALLRLSSFGTGPFVAPNIIRLAQLYPSLNGTRSFVAPTTSSNGARAKGTSAFVVLALLSQLKWGQL